MLLKLKKANCWCPRSKSASLATALCAAIPLARQRDRRIWGSEGGFPVKEKAVAGLDEDVITMSIEAARNALKRAEISAQELRAVWVGSESHPTRSAKRYRGGGSDRRVK